MIYLALSLIVLMISAALANGIAAKLFAAGLALVCLIFLRDMLSGVVDITHEMSEYIFLSSILVFLTAAVFYIIKNLDKAWLPANSIHTYNSIHVPFRGWLILAIGLYFCLLVVSDAVGQSWDEGANLVGEHPWLRITFLIAYYLSVLRLRIMAILRRFKFTFFAELATVIIITVMLREKIYGLFLTLAMTVGVIHFRFKSFALVGTAGILSYFGIAYYRWLGAIIDIDKSKLVDTFYLLLAVPIESGLSSDFSKIFSYYAKNDILLGETYLKILFIPFKLLLGYPTYVNPIYKYYEISNEENLISNMIGSAHPSLFGDSFANFGSFGIFIPCIWFALFLIAEKLFRRGSIRYQCFLMGALLLVPLVARGSIYNGSLLFFVIFSIGIFNVSFLNK
jgi:hypothetical protein